MNYPELPEERKSMLCKYLSQEVFEVLKDKKTQLGYTLKNAINSGLQNTDSNIGIYAGDEETYSLFSGLFDPIIEEYHGFGKEETHKTDFNPDKIIAINPDPEGAFIVSTRIRIARNIDKMPLGPAVTKSQRNLIETKVAACLQNLQGELSGNYYPLLGMSNNTQKSLIKDHFLFKEGDRFLDAAGLNRNWPEGRGIYFNHDKSFLVWINEEDHLRIISMQKGGDIKEVFTRLVKAIKAIQKTVSFSYNDHLGYISSCPTNLGTAMRASVHIALPKLAKEMNLLKKITDFHQLQIRGIHGEHSESNNGVFDISNRRRLGITEVEAVQGMYDGVVALIEAEQALRSK